MHIKLAIEDFYAWQKKNEMLYLHHLTQDFKIVKLNDWNVKSVTDFQTMNAVIDFDRNFSLNFDRYHSLQCHRLSFSLLAIDIVL